MHLVLARRPNPASSKGAAASLTLPRPVSDNSSQAPVAGADGKRTRPAHAWCPLMVAEMRRDPLRSRPGARDASLPSADRADTRSRHPAGIRPQPRGAPRLRGLRVSPTHQEVRRRPVDFHEWSRATRSGWSNSPSWSRFRVALFARAALPSGSPSCVGSRPGRQSSTTFCAAASGGGC
jgi:hypothetical protein